MTAIIYFLALSMSSAFLLIGLMSIVLLVAYAAIRKDSWLLVGSSIFALYSLGCVLYILALLACIKQ